MQQQLVGLARPCGAQPGRAAAPHARAQRRRALRALAPRASAQSQQREQQQREQQQAGAQGLVQRIQAYEHVAFLPGGGRLVVAALRPEWLSQCADLLASSFIAATNILPYGRFVRRRITAYLEEHIRLPPKAVVVAAVLEVPEDSAPPGGAGGGLGAGAAGGGGGWLGSYDSGSWGGGSDAGGGGGPSLGSGANDAAGGLSSVGSFGGRGPLDSMGSSSDGGGGGGGGSAAGSSSGGGARRVLVGTAEVSFDPSTRSSYLTLNPPADCAYICNTAVAPEWRRRGVATHLMRAAEDIAAVAGQRYTYLHLRFKDDAEAGALYRGLGYQEYQKDALWLLLLGQDRRWLMRKRLPGRGE